MRLLLIVLIGGLVSFGLGWALVEAVNNWMPCTDEPSSCKLGEAMGTIAVIGYTPVATLVFGLTAWRAGSKRALDIAALWLIAPMLALWLYGILLEGIPRDIGHEVPDLLRFFGSPVLIVAVQWGILRAYMRRSVPA
jgi:hypothetical protein